MADVPRSYPLGEEDLQRLARERGARVAEHLFGLSIDGLDGSRSIDDHDRFGGGFEDRLRLGLAPANGGGGSPPLADVPGDRGRPDDSTLGVLDRRDGERDVDALPAFGQADRLESLDDLAGAKPLEDLRFLAPAFIWNDARDGSADHLSRGVAEDSLGGPVPGRHDPIQGLPDDGIVGGLHDGGQPCRAVAAPPRVRCHESILRDGQVDRREESRAGRRRGWYTGRAQPRERAEKRREGCGDDPQPSEERETWYAGVLALGENQIRSIVFDVVRGCRLV